MQTAEFREPLFEICRIGCLCITLRIERALI
jgi:hypothetical protein